MSKKIFTVQEIEILKKYKYVKRIGPKGITYTDEMKQYAIEKSDEGMMISRNLHINLHKMTSAFVLRWLAVMQPIRLLYLCQESGLHK